MSGLPEVGAWATVTRTLTYSAVQCSLEGYSSAHVLYLIFRVAYSTLPCPRDELE